MAPRRGRPLGSWLCRNDAWGRPPGLRFRGGRGTAFDSRPLPWVPAFAGTTVGGRVKGRALSLNGITYTPVCKRCLAGNTGRKVLIGDYMMGMR